MGYDMLMALEFPNLSRSYDARGHRVRFWAYDEVLEIAFFVEEAALSRIDPQARRDEAGFLNAFDINRDLIIEVAGELYSRRAHIPWRSQIFKKGRREAFPSDDQRRCQRSRVSASRAFVVL